MFEYSNPGESIKNVARITAVVIFILFLIAAFGMLLSGCEMMNDERTSGTGIVTVIGAIVVGVVGYGIAWLSSLVLYAFGDLVENSRGIASSIKKMQEKSGGMTGNSSNHSAPDGQWTCVCGRQHPAYSYLCVCGVSKEEARKKQNNV